MKIRVHPLAAFGIVFLCASSSPDKICGMTLAALCHELGHLAAGKLIGLNVKSITLMPVGISIEMSEPRSYAGKIFVSLAGPFVNLLICVLSRGDTESALFGFSALLLCLNLLPVRTLDGGTALYSVIAWLISDMAAERITDVLGAAAISLLWLVSVYILFYGSENFALFAFVLFMFATVIIGRDDCFEK